MTAPSHPDPTEPPPADGPDLDALGYGSVDPRTFLLEFLAWAAKHPQFPLMRADHTDHTAVPLSMGAMVFLITEYYKLRLHPAAGTVFDAIQRAKYPPKDAWEKALDDARAKRAQTDDAAEKA